MFGAMRPDAATPALLTHPTRHLFFTGKRGVGKPSLSAATALALADAGKTVFLVSTDAASNLDEMLGVPLRNTPVPVPGAPGLSVLNIDPDTAAEAYRRRVLAQMEAGSTESERSTVREQLSGACTTEIAAFDEFTALLAGDASAYDHIVFDTAPTGHTLRLLSLPKAWTGFLAGNDRGASCLGPHSGLKMQEARFQAAMAALTDAEQTTVVLVARPDASTLDEAGRTAVELSALGLRNQRLVVNGVFIGLGWFVRPLFAERPQLRLGWPTVAGGLESVRFETGEPALGHVERSDTTAVPAASIVAEAMVCLVLAGAPPEKFGAAPL